MTNDLLDTDCLAGSGGIISGDLGFRRRSCCLFYRLPGGGTCGDCPL
jgi:ferric iron reductase protein FhuF